MSRAEFQVYGKPGAYRFRLVAANGENVGPSSEPYTRRADAVRGAEDHRRVAAEAVIVSLENGKARQVRSALIEASRSA